VGTDGATWHYSYNNFSITGYIEIKYIGDSLIDGKVCKVLEKNFIHMIMLQLFLTRLIWGLNLLTQTATKYITIDLINFCVI